jgi:predicted nucleic acid-binding protein
MNIIIDSNSLFSALIKNSKTRRIILEYDNLFLFPSFIFIEMQKHKSELLKKSRMSERDFNKLLQLILRKVVIVPNEVLIPYKKEAYEIVKDIDLDDILFIACALAYPNSVIWSDDKKLKRQSKVKILNTQEIIKFLRKQS